MQAVLYYLDYLARVKLSLNRAIFLMRPTSVLLEMQQRWVVGLP